jgi:7,8-dihydroneopterin aldolase/epimerase/oxygenase
MNKIFITGMEFFAFHGHYDEEKVAGNKFLVDLTLWSDTSSAEKTDNLDDALNYQIAYALVKEVITTTKSNLLENIAANILKALFIEFKNLPKAEITIKKVSPPMGGQIASVGVKIKGKRGDYGSAYPSMVR